MTINNQERRHFRRVPFDAEVVFKSETHDWPCHLIDISLQGALIETKEQWTGSLNDQFTLNVLQVEDSALIHMDVSIQHVKDNFLGLKIKHIDLDSISHLKRLIELNLGSAEAIDRELAELGKQMIST